MLDGMKRKTVLIPKFMLVAMMMACGRSEPQRTPKPTPDVEATVANSSSLSKK